MSHTRREFIKAAVGGSLAACSGAQLPGLGNRSARAATTGKRGDTVLVVIELAGGNDGLNTVVPYNDRQYIESRPTLHLPADKVHKIDSKLGFHPRMDAFKRLYEEGHLSVVQGVGYPNSNRNHEEAARDWHSAAPGDATCQTGWLGRAADEASRLQEASSPDKASVPAAFVGSGKQPFSLHAARAVVPGIRSLDQHVLRALPGGDEPDELQMERTAKAPRPGNPNRLLDFLQQGTLEACAASRQMRAVSKDTTSAGDYPPFHLAKMLRLVARLIRADVGIRIFCTDLGGGDIGGFDNHANQLGNHCALVNQLSESVAAMVDDLKRDNLLDRVLVMTCSEFGRTLAENGRHGTGHGAAAPMFLVGGRLKGGLVGEHPSLKDLDQGAQKVHTDFRRVYATALESWLGMDSRPVLGGDYKPLDVFRA